MNHKSISTAIKRALTFMLAFAMIATSLYVAPAANAEELDGDEIILDESSSEVVEEEIIGEGEAEDADKFVEEEGGGANYYKHLSYYFDEETVNDVKKGAGSGMAAAVGKVVESDVKFGRFDKQNENYNYELEELTEIGLKSKATDTATYSGTDYIYEITKVGDETVDPEAGSGEAGNYEDLLEALDISTGANDTVTISVKVSAVNVVLGAAESTTAVGTYALKIKVEGLEGNLYYTPAENAEPIEVGKGGGSMSAAVLTALIGADLDIKQIDNNGALGAIASNGIFDDASDVNKRGAVMALETITVGDNVYSKNLGDVLDDVIQKINPGETFTAGFSAVGYTCESSSSNAKKVDGSKITGSVAMKIAPVAGALALDGTAPALAQSLTKKASKMDEDLIAKYEAVKVNEYKTKGSGSRVELGTAETVVIKNKTEGTGTGGALATGDVQYKVSIAEVDGTAVNNDHSADNLLKALNCGTYDVLIKVAKETYDDTTGSEGFKAATTGAISELYIPAKVTISVTNGITATYSGEEVKIPFDTTSGTKYDDVVAAIKEVIAVSGTLKAEGDSLTGYTGKVLYITRVGSVVTSGKTNVETELAKIKATTDEPDIEITIKNCTGGTVSTEALEPWVGTLKSKSFEAKAKAAKGKIFVDTEGVAAIMVPAGDDAATTETAIKKAIAGNLPIAKVTEMGDDAVGAVSGKLAGAKDKAASAGNYYLVEVTTTIDNTLLGEIGKTGVGVDIGFTVDSYTVTKETGKDAVWAEKDAANKSEAAKIRIKLMPKNGTIYEVKDGDDVVSPFLYGEIAITEDEVTANSVKNLNDAIAKILNVYAYIDGVPTKVAVTEKSTLADKTKNKADTLYYVWAVANVGDERIESNESNLDDSLKSANSGALKIAVASVLSGSDGTVDLNSPVSAVTDVVGSINIVPAYDLNVTAEEIDIVAGTKASDLQKLLGASVNKFSGYDEEGSAQYKGTNVGVWELPKTNPAENAILYLLTLDGISADSDGKISTAGPYNVTVKAEAYKGVENDAPTSAVTVLSDFTAAKPVKVNVIEEGKISSVAVEEGLKLVYPEQEDADKLIALIEKAIDKKVIVKTMGKDSVEATASNVISKTEYDKLETKDEKITYYVWSITDLTGYQYKSSPQTFKVSIETSKGETAKSDAINVTVGHVDGYIDDKGYNSNGNVLPTSMKKTSAAAILSMIRSRLSSTYVHVWKDGKEEWVKPETAMPTSFGDSISYVLDVSKIEIEGQTVAATGDDVDKAIKDAIKAVEVGDGIDVKYTIAAYVKDAEGATGYKTVGEAREITESITVEAGGEYTVDFEVYSDKNLIHKEKTSTGTVKAGTVIGDISGLAVGKLNVNVWYNP